MDDLTQCSSDCGCAGGQPSETCAFDPPCLRCVMNPPNKALSYVERQMRTNPNWQEQARRDIARWNDSPRQTCTFCGAADHASSDCAIFDDVKEAREIRRQVLNREVSFAYGQPRRRCPVCHNQIDEHNSRVNWPDQTPNGSQIPCWRRGEWDRYGLHIAPTRVQESEIWLIP